MGVGIEAVPQEDAPLFERLRAMRAEIARARNVPAYVVCHDSTLRSMAALKPATREALLTVYGMGERKADDIGPAFLAVINGEIAARSADPTPEPAAVPTLSPDPFPDPAPAVSRSQRIADAWQAGRSAASIAARFGMPRGEVLELLDDLGLLHP